METHTYFTLRELHKAIIADIKAAFPQFKTVDAYREDERASLPLPACLLELTEMPIDADGDPDTGQLGLEIEFALIVSDHFTSIDEIGIRQLALDLGAWLQKRRFNKRELVIEGEGESAQTIERVIGKVQTPGAAMVTGIYPADFQTLGTKRDGELPQFLSWRVEFRVQAWGGASQLDESLFDEDGNWR